MLSYCHFSRLFLCYILQILLRLARDLFVLLVSAVLVRTHVGLNGLGDRHIFETSSSIFNLGLGFFLLLGLAKSKH